MKKSKTIQSKSNNNGVAKKNAIFYIAAGAGLFILRYIPTVQYGAGAITKWYSVDAANSFCNSFFGMVADNCNWVKPLNVIMIVGSIGLVAWGVYSLYNLNKK